MKTLLALLALVLCASCASPERYVRADAPTFEVVDLDSKEVALVCVNGSRPLISETSNLPDVVTIKCQ
jgi:hypothetical protein